MKLWYEQPASIFEEALPIGNGRLGAMVYGGVMKEKLSLNEDTCWAGYPQDKSNTEAQPYLQKARDAIVQGNKLEAQEILWKHLMTTWTESYQPVGNLVLEMGHGGGAIGYSRNLNLEEAVATTTYTVNDVTYTRKAYASFPDQVMVLHMTASEPRKLSVTMYMESPHPVHMSQIKVEGEAFYVMTGNTPAYTAPNYYADKNSIRYEVDGHCGLTFFAAVMPRVIGGSFYTEKDKLVIENADDIIFYINVRTNFAGMDVDPKNSKVDAADVCIKTLQKIINQDEKELMQQHIKNYQTLYKRVTFHLEGKNCESVPTDKRIRNYESDKTDNMLPVLLFQYGRYLLISSSREGTQPANLQGIWNESVRPPWSSNYTLNINAQMNYWLAESTNLSECHMPLFKYIEGLATHGMRTAKNNYGFRGWCAHHNSDIWRQTEAVGSLASDNSCSSYAFWPHGGSWIVHHIWEHYEFTGDREFLKTYEEIIYGAGAFLMDWITERDGKIVMSPAISPENTYWENGQRLAICENSAMDLAILRDIMNICIMTNKVLGDAPDFSKQCEQIVEKTPEYRVGSKGQLLEWDDEYEETEPLHRHLSLLYGFYPGNSMNHNDTPNLMAPIKTTMNLRGDVATGWGIAWKINVWARLQDGDHTKKVLDYMLHYVDCLKVDMGAAGGVYPNLFDAHPPFQIDGNFGAAAGMAEMLLQSHEGYVHLLPALPSAWKKGSIEGLCARGGLQVSMEWEEGKLTKASITAKKAQQARITYNEIIWNIDLEKDEILWLSM